MRKILAVISFFFIEMILWPVHFVWAGSETETRIANSAKVGAAGAVPACAGHLNETYFEEGNTSSFENALRLICTPDMKTATWVLVSSTGCSDYRNGSCFKGNAKSIPSFVVGKGPDDYIDSKPPYRVQYRLIKYGLGYDCQVISQQFTTTNDIVKTTPNHDDRWMCARVDIFDGTKDGDITDPKLFHTVIVETNGDQQFENVDADDPFPDNFILSSEMYNYSYSK